MHSVKGSTAFDDEELGVVSAEDDDGWGSPSVEEEDLILHISFNTSMVWRKSALSISSTLQSPNIPFSSPIRRTTFSLLAPSHRGVIYIARGMVLLFSNFSFMHLATAGSIPVMEEDEGIVDSLEDEYVVVESLEEDERTSTTVEDKGLSITEEEDSFADELDGSSPPPPSLEHAKKIAARPTAIADFR
jgi:hypothetical protein